MSTLESFFIVLSGCFGISFSFVCWLWPDSGNISGLALARLGLSSSAEYYVSVPPGRPGKVNKTYEKHMES